MRGFDIAKFETISGENSLTRFFRGGCSRPGYSRMFWEWVFAMKLTTYFNSTVTLLSQTDRSTHNDSNSSSPQNFRQWPWRVDFGNILAEIHPEDFPINQWENILDFKSWLQVMFHEFSNGTYYLFSRCIAKYPDKRKKKPHSGRTGRPIYGYSNPRKLKYYKQAWKSSAGRAICLAKFQLEDGEVVNIPERQERRKRRPHHRPLYPVIKRIQQNQNTVDEHID